jgi:hypothetical protein
MKPCYFCQRPSIASCSTATQDRWIALPDEIRVGDLIQWPCDLQFYKVVGWAKAITEDYWIGELVGGRRVIEEFRAQLPIVRLLKTPCGIFACERHMRELDDDVFQCAEHWTDFERVYSAA